MAEVIDPYVYPNSSVLKNLFNLRSSTELEQAEYAATFARHEELENGPIHGPFDLDRLQQTHFRLFQDVYVWAGQLRRVEISKGSSQFHASTRIATAMNHTSDWLLESRLLDPSVDDIDFVKQASELLEQINYIHPFREGNGRTQRAFLDQVAAVSNRRLAWRNISQREHLLASIKAFNSGSGEPFWPIFQQILQPPLDGLSPLDPDVYEVAPRRLEPRRKTVPGTTPHQPTDELIEQAPIDYELEL